MTVAMEVTAAAASTAVESACVNGALLPISMSVPTSAVVLALSAAAAVVQAAVVR